MLAPSQTTPELTLDTAIVYDIETLKNAFTFHFVELFSDSEGTFEISQYRDDRQYLFQWFAHWQVNHTIMIGFNSVGFDYTVIHFIFNNPNCSVTDIYECAQGIIQSQERFGSTIRDYERFAPQCDLFLLHHFNNRAKSTSLKALEFAMRSELVLDMPVPFDQPLTAEQIATLVRPYNRHDVLETRRFALFSLDAIKFRLQLSKTLKGDVLNFNDSKIGSKILEQRLGPDLCYDENRQARGTFRTSIALRDIIFPYVEFQQPEFRRILDWMRSQTLTADQLDIESENATKIRTKGVFAGVTATIRGFEFDFGTGGIHGSVTAGRFASVNGYQIVDIDVAALYPSIAIVNGLYPEHLGEAFVREYAKLPLERNKHKKGTVENAAFKLASNGTYGNSNNRYSCFYDPRFTMAITINGQLLLCMLAEMLLTVSTLQILTINTDGILYRVHESRLEHAKALRRMWESFTKLKLEEVIYSRLWLRDVNSFVIEGADGKCKLKGAYWYPERFPEDISTSSPPAWHKDYSAQVVIKAAVAHMVHGVDIGRFVRSHADPFDFMLRAKVDRASKLMIGDKEVQRITRYYIAIDGEPMRKVSPPKGPPGAFKRRNGITDYEFETILASLPPGTHDPRIHTKNKSRYETRVIGIDAGRLVVECNRASDFDGARVDFDWYVAAAAKLVIP